MPRAILRRPLYRGEIVYNKSRQRDQWGQKRHQRRDPSEWIHFDAPDLRIVPPELAAAVDSQIEAMHAKIMRTSDGRLLGRPPGSGAKYLLTGLLRCAVCGGGFEALSRKHGRRRAYVYGCATHRRKGACICGNGLVVPMEDADTTVLGAVEQTLMNPAVVEWAIEYAISTIEAHRSDKRRKALEAA